MAMCQAMCFHGDVHLVNKAEGPLHQMPKQKDKKVTDRYFNIKYKDIKMDIKTAIVKKNLFKICVQHCPRKHSSETGL